MTTITLERPAIRRIRFSYTDSEDQNQRVVQRWRWCRLEEVVECLNSQKRGITFTSDNVIRNFAVLSGRDGFQIYISFFAKFTGGQGHGHHIHLNQVVEEFRGIAPDTEYYIPAGWSMRITDQQLSKVVSAELLFPPNALVNDTPKLLGVNSNGEGHELPLKLSPVIDTWHVEP